MYCTYHTRLGEYSEVLHLLYWPIEYSEVLYTGQCLTRRVQWITVYWPVPD